MFGIDPPVLDSSLARFERSRKLFIGQIGIRIIVSRHYNGFPQFDADGIASFFCDLVEPAPTMTPIVWAIFFASVMRFLEANTSNGWNVEYVE